MTEFAQILRLFTEGGIESILIGGTAAAAHGSARSTRDIDFVYRRSQENIDRLVRILTPLQPYLRGAPPGLPFFWDRRTIESGMNFTLTTTLGHVDLMGEITGGGSYDDLLPHSMLLTVHGVEVRCIDLDWLIRVKRAAGRPKDLESIAELEALQEEARSKETGSA